MKNYFQQSLLLACASAVSASLLMSAPAARAGICEDNYGTNGISDPIGFANCQKLPPKTIWQRTLDRNKPAPTNMKDFAGGFSNLLFSLRPSLMYSNGGIGYGAQTRFDMSQEADVRLGLHFQPEITTLDISANYKFGEYGQIRPFIGGGWQNKSFGSNYTGPRPRSSDIGVSLIAGVDIPLGNISKISARIDQPLSSIVSSLLPFSEDSPSSSTEFQVMLSLFDF
jgi:hypothetical protein